MLGGSIKRLVFGQSMALSRRFSGTKTRYMMVSGFNEQDSKLSVRLMLDEDYELYTDIFPVKTRFGQQTGKFVLKIREDIPWKVLVDHYVSSRNAFLDPHKYEKSDKELLEQIGSSEQKCEEYILKILKLYKKSPNGRSESHGAKVKSRRARHQMMVGGRWLNFSLFSKGVKQESDPEDLYYKCYVSNLPLDLTANEFKSFVSQFPKYKGVFIPNKLDTTAKGTLSCK